MEETTTRRHSSREAIIAAATELIRTRGVAGTSISDVIAASGTSAGAIYHHFGSKERLVLEVGKAAIAVPMTMIMRTSPGLSPASLFAAALGRLSGSDGLAEMLLQVWSGARSDPGLQALLRAEVDTAQSSVVAYLAVWCHQNAPDTDPAALASLIMGLITGYAVQQALGASLDADAYRDLGVRLLAQALGDSDPANGVPDSV